MILETIISLFLLFSRPREIIIYPEPPTILIATVTAYSSVETCENTDCIMANSEKAFVGAIACPRSIALNTFVKMRGTTYKCADRTHKRFDGRFDIFMGYGEEAHERAIEFGRQTIPILL